jgi:hypothetical protein
MRVKQLEASLYSKRPFWTDCVTAVLIASIFVVQVRACDVCFRLPGIPFEADHPAAIEVAMATRDAADRGDLDLNPLLIPLLSVNRHLSVRLDKITPQRLVQFWSRTYPAKDLAELRFTLDLVFVDAESTCQLDVRFGEFLVDSARNGPADIRMFTTKAGFQRLFLDGFDRCEQLGFVKLESEGVQLREGLAQLFAASQKDAASPHLTSL